MTEEYKSEFTFKLSTPIFYQEGGDARVPCNELTLKAPSSGKKGLTSKLRQGYYSAQIEMTAIVQNLTRSEDTDKIKKEKEELSDDQKKEDDIQAFFMCMRAATKIDYGNYHETFRILLLKDTAFVADGIPLTKNLYNLIDDNDTERLLGEYMANFLLS